MSSGQVVERPRNVRDGSDSDLRAHPATRLLLPGKRTLAGGGGRSASCQQETHAPQQTALLFDHLVRAKQNRGWYCYAYRLCGLDVYNELEIRWQLNRQIC